jgi:hypothetical protein
MANTQRSERRLPPNYRSYVFAALGTVAIVDLVHLLRSMATAKVTKFWAQRAV